MVYLITSTFDPSLAEDFRKALGDLPTTCVNGVTQRLNNVAYADELHLLSGPGFIRERLDRFTFNISPNSFFQTNSEQAARLYRIALDFAELRPGDLAFDLYCGTGTIATLMSGQAGRVHGFEQDAGAVRDAVENARANGVANCSFTQVDLRRFADVAPGPPDVVITDPPRAGMHVDTVEHIRLLAPRRVVYVSCNPASLARDAKALCDGGRFALAEAQPVDMFPQTYHVETVARFDRVD
jgi:23S rRNA (uracil1939-C5)-methyltransferase